MTPLEQDSLEHIYKLMAAAGIVGAGGRAAFGMGDLLGKGLSGPKPPPPPMVVNVPYKVRKPKVTDADKVASDHPLGSLGDAWNYFADKPYWYMPAAGAGIAGAGMAGWKGMDKLVRSRKHEALAQDIEDEQRRLQEAELAKFNPIELGKTASQYQALLAGTPVDDPEWKAASNAVEKVASHLGALGGIALTAAALSALGGGHLGYSVARNTNPELARMKGIKDQLAEEEAMRAPEMMARLVPVEDTGEPMAPRKEKALQKKEPERLIPGSVKTSSAALEERARRFVAELLGR